MKFYFLLFFISINFCLAQSVKFTIEKACKNCKGNYIVIKNSKGERSDTIKVHVGNHYFINNDTIYDIHEEYNITYRSFSIGIKKGLINNGSYAYLDKKIFNISFDSYVYLNYGLENRIIQVDQNRYERTSKLINSSKVVYHNNCFILSMGIGKDKKKYTIDYDSINLNNVDQILKQKIESNFKVTDYWYKINIDIAKDYRKNLILDSLEKKN